MRRILKEESKSNMSLPATPQREAPQRAFEIPGSSGSSRIEVHFLGSARMQVFLSLSRQDRQLVGSGCYFLVKGLFIQFFQQPLRKNVLLFW